MVNRMMIIPTLRFPEFNSEWETKKLSELLEFKNGINADKEQYGSGVKFVNVLDILNNDFITYENIIGSVEIDDVTFKNYTVNYGDILFQRSSETREEVGTACVYLDKEKKATFGGFVIRGKKIGEYDPIFLNKLLKTDIARDEITSKSGGGIRYNVGQGTLSSILLPFPTIPEQQKIVSFFVAVDKRIEQLSRKKNFLEQYKQGVMQKIYSQEIRFKDNESKLFPNWVEKKLGEVLIKNSKKNKDLKYNIVQSVSNKHGFINQVEYFEDRVIASKDLSNYYVIIKGSFAYNPSRINVGSLAYKSDNNISVISPLYVSFIANNNFLNDKFLLNWFFSTAFIKQMNASLEGGVRNTLSYELLTHISIKLPCLEEQTLIANFLTCIDKKIDIVTTQLQKTQVWKKGLIQKMFV